MFVSKSATISNQQEKKVKKNAWTTRPSRLTAPNTFSNMEIKKQKKNILFIYLFPPFATDATAKIAAMPPPTKSKGLVGAEAKGSASTAAAAAPGFPPPS